MLTLCAMPPPSVPQTLSDPNEDILKGVHVIVGTPHHLARALNEY